jgi:hypothetical protein
MSFSLPNKVFEYNAYEMFVKQEFLLIGDIPKTIHGGFVS